MRDQPEADGVINGLVTQDQIAAATCYSLPTASRVLSNSRYSIKQHVRERMLETARQAQCDT